MDKKWNLQDIKPVSQSQKRRARPALATEPVVKPVQDDDDDDSGTLHIAIENGTKKKNFSLLLVIGVFFVIVGLGFFFSFLSSGTEITVEPRNRIPTVNATFDTYKSPPVGELAYELMTLEAEGERQVSATGQELIEEQATGELTIYKSTPGAERLIKNTRFESPSGQIFRITESAVVPGAVENSSGELISGSIKAIAFADSVGDTYNLNAGTEFTVPGFKEGGYDDLFAAVTATNEQDIIGGFSGKKFIIDEAELETAQQALQMELRDSLLERIDSEKPTGFVVFDNAVTFTYQSLPAVEYGDNLATIKERALLQIPIFKKEDFAAFIAKATVPGYEGEAVRIDNLTDLTFSYSSATTTSFDIGNLDVLTFKLTGKPQLVWTFDVENLKADLLGAPKASLNSVLTAYPALIKAQAVVKPFWKRTYPTKTKDIEIIEVIK